MRKLLNKILSTFKTTKEASSDTQTNVVIPRSATKKFLDEAMNSSDSRKAPYALQYIKEVGETDIDDCDGDSILSIYNYGRQFFESCSAKNGTDLKLRETLYPIFVKFEWAYEKKSYGNPASAIRHRASKNAFGLDESRAQELLGESFEELEKRYLNELDFSLTQKNCRFTGFFECLNRKAELSADAEERISIAETFLHGLDLIDEGGLHFCYKSALKMFDLHDSIGVFDHEPLKRYSDLLERLSLHYEEQPSHQHHRFPEFMEQFQAIKEQYKIDTAGQGNANEAKSSQLEERKQYLLQTNVLRKSWGLDQEYDKNVLLEKYKQKIGCVSSEEEVSIIEDEFKFLKIYALQTA